MFRPRQLIIALAIALLAGCTTPQPLDPRDPAIFRPTHPVYPVPEK